MDLSLVNIQNGLIEHKNIAKIPLVSLLCMTEHLVVSYFGN